ncbi:MAG: acetyl-CoA carboxylase carboxyltransferase subunit beta [Lachnospiraceae bacterium]|jgi:acetyl-CoA carboxylase carboxyl transferase alpha subunit/acetyl-CoA carboxylase carboxyl transferase beta subunit|nr:acetyl-CoA carboxylase carboxyltransferase subunit beta [Lachnospiraceae bacterium]
MLKDMFKKNTYISEVDSEKENVPSIPKGLWMKCSHCSQMIYKEDFIENHNICPKCGFYFRMDARERIEMIADIYTFEEWDEKMPILNPLDFPGYSEKLKEAQEKTGLSEAVVTGKMFIFGQPCVVGVCDSRFLMSSMGRNVGEKITRAVERATKEKLPIILFTASGGARMQEGIISLMQMAKTSAALKCHSDAGLLYITVLTDPTTGGVTASFAMLGDIILSEPNALIGFAGPRVIEQTIGRKLPEGFQRSEFLLEHGFVDKIVERGLLKETLGRLLRYHKKVEKPIHMGRDTILLKERDRELEKAIAQRKEKQIEPWERVKRSRNTKRPTSLDYIKRIFKGFIELHGDRVYGEDRAMIVGVALIGGIPVTVIGQQKGRSIKENIERNFGMSNPEGYRKALRLMKQAEKFKRPIICFVDTAGAACGMEAEERGQGEAIARNLFEMASLNVPVLSILIGEGGSGGALALAVANEVWMMENATYSVLSPEGFASILWKDNKRAQEATQVMKITAQDLWELGIIEKIIREPIEASEENIDSLCAYLKQGIKEFIEKYRYMESEQLRKHRYERFRKM